MLAAAPDSREEAEDPRLEEAQELIAEAKRVFCLGFGYAHENVDILRLPDLMPWTCNLYGTALGLEQKEIEDIDESDRWKLDDEDEEEEEKEDKI